MVDIENAEQGPELLSLFQQRLKRLLDENKLSARSLLVQVNALCEHMKAECARNGIRFPDMAVLVLPSVGALEMVRRELDQQGLDNTVVHIVRTYPGIDVREVAEAFRYAFPEYRPARLQ